MRRHLKVAVSILLLLCYLASPVSVLAAIVQTTMLENGTKVSQISNVKTANYEMTGNLEVVLGLELPVSNKREKVIKFTIADESNNQMDIDINLNGENPTETASLGMQNLQIVVDKANQNRDKVQDGEEFYYLNFAVEGLKTGKYSVKLESEGFVPYEYKDIEILEYSKRLSLTNQKGTFAIGDINGDKKVSQADYDLAVSKIEATRRNE